jgi:hypothetical protein
MIMIPIYDFAVYEVRLHICPSCVPLGIAIIETRDIG